MRFLKTFLSVSLLLVAISAKAQTVDAVCDSLLPLQPSRSTYTPAQVSGPDTSRTVYELEREGTTYEFAKRPGNVSTHTLGLTTGEFNYAIQTQIKRISERNTKGTCLRPQFTSNLSFKDMTVYIASELDNFPCLARLTLEHENRHVAINQKNLILLTPMVQQLLNQNSNAVYFPPGVSEQDQIRYVENLQTELGEEVNKLFSEKNLFHRDFDKADYQKNESSNVCGDEKRRFKN